MIYMEVLFFSSCLFFRPKTNLRGEEDIKKLDSCSSYIDLQALIVHCVRTTIYTEHNNGFDDSNWMSSAMNGDREYDGTTKMRDGQKSLNTFSFNIHSHIAVLCCAVCVCVCLRGQFKYYQIGIIHIWWNQHNKQYKNLILNVPNFLCVVVANMHSCHIDEGGGTRAIDCLCVWWNACCPNVETLICLPNDERRKMKIL